MIRHLLALAAVAGVALPAEAVIVTQFNFNSVMPDAMTGTGTTLPSTGSGTAATVGTTASFASGDANGGSSDPAVGDDSGWGITTFAAQGAGDKTRGVQFNVSTVGFQDVVVNYDHRFSNTASRYSLFQYTLDGSTFVDFATFDASLGGDTWYNNRSVDLSAITGADNNGSFGFRVVAAFAPGTSNYAAAATTSTYATGGTWRFDQVTVSAVPEPETYALLLAGLLAIGFVVHRRDPS